MPVSSPDMPVEIPKTEQVVSRPAQESSVRKPLSERVKGLLKVFKRNDAAKNPEAVLQAIVDLPSATERPGQQFIEATQQDQENETGKQDPVAVSRDESAIRPVEEPLEGKHVKQDPPDEAGVTVAELGASQNAEENAASEGAQLTPSESRELNFKQNEVKWKVDDLMNDIDRVNKGIFSDALKTYAEGKVEQNLDWIAENPDRASQAIEHILAQENIIDRASALPGLSATEKESISYMYDSFGRVRKGLEDRGVTIASRKQLSGRRAEDKNENISANNLHTPFDNAGVPIDTEKAYEYAYHATPLVSIPSIAEHGLLPSPEWSKEPGTIFFNDYEYSTSYLPPIGMLYRTHITHMPEITPEDLDYKTPGGKPNLQGLYVSRTQIPASLLEYSFDRGKTWRKDMTPFIIKSDDRVT